MHVNSYENEYLTVKNLYNTQNHWTKNSQRASQWEQTSSNLRANTAVENSCSSNEQGPAMKIDQQQQERRQGVHASTAKTVPNGAERVHLRLWLSSASANNNSNNSVTQSKGFYISLPIKTLFLVSNVEWNIIGVLKYMREWWFIKPNLYQKTKKKLTNRTRTCKLK